jgi:hypothetical protein
MNANHLRMTSNPLAHFSVASRLPHASHTHLSLIGFTRRSGKPSNLPIRLNLDGTDSESDGFQ